jgi:hypothetical protein
MTKGNGRMIDDGLYGDLEEFRKELREIAEDLPHDLKELLDASLDERFEQD